MPTQNSIEIWRSQTGISDGCFSLLTTLLDTGGSFQFPDQAIFSQQVYIYQARRYDAASGLYSAWSLLVYARAPWPVPTGTHTVPNTNTGLQSILGIAREATEGVPTMQQKGYSRKSGSYDLEMTNPDRDELRNIDTDFEEVPGFTRVTGGPFVSPLTPEGYSRHLTALFGNPVTTLGGGAPPAAPVPTTATNGGTIGAALTVSVKVAYVGPSPIVGGPANTADTASAAGSVTTGAGATNSITVPSPAAQGGATGYNVYAGPVGQEVLQNAAPVAIGTAAVITALLAAGAAAPSSYNIHTYKSQQQQVPHTLTEKRGSSLYAFPGGYVDTWNMAIDKTQTTPIEVSVGWKLLNQLVYQQMSDVGLDVVGFDPLPSFGGSQAIVTLGGILPDNLKTVDVKIAKNMKERDVLNGKMGPSTHFQGDKAAYTGTLGMYFEDEAQMNVMWGELVSVSKPYGARKARMTTQLVVAIIGEINAAGFRNAFVYTFPKIAYKKVGKPVQGQGEIMQSAEWKAYYSQPDGTGVILQVYNSESFANITAPGTPIAAIPTVNDVN